MGRRSPDPIKGKGSQDSDTYLSARVKDDKDSQRAYSRDSSPQPRDSSTTFDSEQQAVTREYHSFMKREATNEPLLGFAGSKAKWAHFEPFSQSPFNSKDFCRSIEQAHKTLKQDIPATGAEDTDIVSAFDSLIDTMMSVTRPDQLSDYGVFSGYFEGLRTMKAALTAERCSRIFVTEYLDKTPTGKTWRPDQDSVGRNSYDEFHWLDLRNPMYLSHTHAKSIVFYEGPFGNASDASRERGQLRDKLGSHWGTSLNLDSGKHAYRRTRELITERLPLIIAEREDLASAFVLSQLTGKDEEPPSYLESLGGQRIKDVGHADTRAIDPSSDEPDLAHIGSHGRLLKCGKSAFLPPAGWSDSSSVHAWEPIRQVLGFRITEPQGLETDIKGKQ